MDNKVRNRGELDLAGMKIPCYVLEDGTRVLSGRGMQQALCMAEENDRSSAKLTRYLNQESLKPFIYKGKGVGHFNPVICYDGDAKINGYEATALVDICDAFLEARKHIRLSSRQAIIADQCEMLVRAFARVGIIALVDEATGYQHDREKDELQKILKAFISEELLPWQKRFPDIYYEELFRLNGWDYTIKDIRKRPGVIGKWTNELIYKQLPKGVLDELKIKTPKSPQGNKTARFHQSLSEDVGHPALNAQITQIVTLFQLSDNMRQMWTQFEKLKSRQSGQLSLPFNFDNEGRTIEPIDSSNMSEFDRSLQKALSHNPHKKEEPSI